MADWPHAPPHRLGNTGAYMVTAGTYQKKLLFSTADKLTLVHDQLLHLAGKYRWNLHAWAVLGNHYHFLATSPDDPGSLRAFIRHLNSVTAIAVNRIDGENGRRVWYQYWDTHITFRRSYLARLNYVNRNPVHHGLVATPEEYPWCSAAWFENTASPNLVKTVRSCRTDRLGIDDDF